MKLYEQMNKDNTALVIIDVVNGCANQECESPEYGITFSKIREMVPSLKEFIDTFRKEVGAQIIFINIAPWVKGEVAENITELYETYPETNYFSDNNSEFEGSYFGIDPQEGDIRLTKNTTSSFADGKLGKVLKEKGIKYLIVSGIFGDGCVMATVEHGFGLGYGFVLLDDFIETTDVPKRQELQKLLKTIAWPNLIGPVMTGKEFVESWKEQKIS
ncbi:MAG: cysteine hydrolase [Candidatus Pacebacteria bacterium]|nr:cysteine hydrolase [Candidatus Paceibacterota bacterium]